MPVNVITDPRAVVPSSPNCVLMNVLISQWTEIAVLYRVLPSKDCEATDDCFSSFGLPSECSVPVSKRSSKTIRRISSIPCASNSESFSRRLSIDGEGLFGDRVLQEVWVRVASATCGGVVSSGVLELIACLRDNIA